MAFFNSAVTVLQNLVIALGAGLGIWGAINLLEGYGNDNPGANAHVLSLIHIYVIILILKILNLVILILSFLPEMVE